MISDEFDIYNYHIKIFYLVTCNDLNIIIQALEDINCPEKYILEAIDNLDRCKLNTGLTYSNLKLKSSVIVISEASSDELLINTISHEYFHLICHLSKVLNIIDEEKLASLNGDLNMQSYKLLFRSRFKI